jgi:hypothetical protein
VPRVRSHPTTSRRAMGPPLFCDDRLERLDIERLLGHDLFQPTVLVFDLFQPLHLAELHAAVLRFPAVVRLLGNPMRPTQVGDFPTGFALFDDRQDLLVGEFAPFHRSSSERRASFYGVADYWGQVNFEHFFY